MSMLLLESVEVAYPIRQKTKETASRVDKRTTGGEIRTAANDQDYVYALDGIDLAINEGDCVGVIGYNGAGKSTLLKVAAGIIEPTSGRLERRGRCVTMFNYNLGSNMDASGYENLFNYGFIQGLTPQEIHEIVDDVIEFAELGAFIDLPLRTYSAGMKARLAFGVATSIPADILIMDEWISFGDRVFLNKVAERFKAFVSSSSILILASHNMPLLKQQCTRGLVLKSGSLAFDGEMGEAITYFQGLGNAKAEKTG